MHLDEKQKLISSVKCDVYVNCRKTKSCSKDSTLQNPTESKKLSPCRNTLLLLNKKCLNPLPGLYKNLFKYTSTSYFIIFVMLHIYV